MADTVTWQAAVEAGRALARAEWQAENLPGPHVVWTAGALSLGVEWVLIHGTRQWVMDADADGIVMDPPVVAVDKITGEVRVCTGMDLGTAETDGVAGQVPPHLAMGLQD